MNLKVRNIIIYSFLTYIGIGIILSLIYKDEQVESGYLQELAAQLPNSLFELSGAIFFRYIMPVILWPVVVFIILMA